MTRRTTLTIAGVSAAAVLAGGALTAAALPSVAEAQLVATSESTPAPSDATDGSRGPHEANGITEEELTGDIADQVEAAVLAQYPDATIERMETDAEGAAYEAHITQADGTHLTVLLDGSFAITGTETGGPGGGRGDRPDPGSTDDTSAGDTAS